MIYLDNAATTFPKPQCVIDAVAEFMQNYGGNPGRGGHYLSRLSGEKVLECREELARLIGADNPEQIIFTKNATEAINLAIKGTVSPGDEIILSSMEHNSVLRSAVALEKKGVRVKIACADSSGYVSEESITASHILIQSAKPGDPAEDKKAEAKAKAILAQIRQGADFGTLAQAESACPSGKRAKGALGKMTKATLDQDFWNAAFKLKKGEISDVVKTQFGYHIIRLEDKTEAVPLKFEELKADIIAHLTDQKIQEKVAAAVEEATKSGFVKMGNF